MKTETARMLVETIANSLNIAIDNRNRLTALEKIFHDQDPVLFQKYMNLLDAVRQNPPTVISPAGFATLQSKLAQD
jgi:hypothetical protein